MEWLGFRLGGAPAPCAAPQPSSKDDGLCYSVEPAARDDPYLARMGEPEAAPTLFSDPIGEDGEQLEAPPQQPLASFSLPIVHDPGRSQLEDNVNFARDVGSVIAGRYEITGSLGSGSFSHAVQCRHKANGGAVCVKIVRNNKDFLDQSLSEVKILQMLNSADPNDSRSILRLVEFFYFKEHLFIVTELLRDNLYVVYQYADLYFTLPRIRSLARQTFAALDFLHGQSIYHCDLLGWKRRPSTGDLKPENILLSSFSRCLIKIIDFGSSCFASESHSSYVQSRSYRAPEVILGAPYNHKIDLWSAGCILAELFARRVLFRQDSAQTLLASMMALVGRVGQPAGGPPAMPEYLMRTGRLAGKYFTSAGKVYLARQGVSGEHFYAARLMPLSKEADGPTYDHQD